MFSLIEGFVSLMFSEQGVRVLSIIALAIVVRVLLSFVIGGVVQRVPDGGQRGKRIRTLSSIFYTTASVVVFTVALLMILREVGFDITPLIASAGIVGLAVGFGAQTLVKDVISGLFLLIEGQFNEGDEVEIGGKKGKVQKISLRTVTLKDKDSVCHIIPNGSITMVSNFSKD